MRSETRSRKEYLTPKNNIIVLDSYFKLTNKSSHSQVLMRFNTVFYHSVVAYFFGPPCIYKCMTTDYLASINRPMSLAVLADNGDAFSHVQIQNLDVAG